MNAALFLLFNINQNEADIRERRRKRAAYRRVNLERKGLRDCSNPFNLEEEHFRKLYRLELIHDYKATFIYKFLSSNISIMQH